MGNEEEWEDVLRRKKWWNGIVRSSKEEDSSGEIREVNTWEKRESKCEGHVRLKGNNGMGEERKETEMDWEIRGMEMNQGKKRRDANEYELEETKG